MEHSSRRLAEEPPGALATPVAEGALTAGLLLTVVCVALDGLAVTTVMPVAVRDLHGLAAYGWTFSAFMLASVIGITAAGRHTDRHGPGGAFAASLVLFGLGLAAGGAAPSMAAFVAARAVQGLGAGGLSAVIYASVARCYPTERQPRMLALLSTAWVVPGLVGPGLGGFVADHASWRLVFFGLLPVVVVCAALTLPALRTVRPVPAAAAGSAGPNPIGHAALLAGGTAAVLLALESRSAGAAAGLLALGVAAIRPGVRRLMPAGTLQGRAGLPAAVAAMGLISFAFFGAEALLPLFLTVFRGQPATVAGLALSGATITWTAGAWVQARAARRGARAALVAAGAALVACGIAVVALVLLDGSPVLLAPAGWAVVGLGMGIAHATISLAVIEQAPEGGEGTASAGMQLANVLGVAFGTGTGGTAVALVERGALSPQAGFAAAFAGMLAVALVTIALARRLPQPPGRR